MNQQDKDREGFEAFAFNKHWDMRKLPSGNYLHPHIQIRWEAWQAASQSQDREDAERYRKLVADWFDNVHDGEFELMNDMPPDAYQSKADIDEAIDKTMEKQK